MAAADYRLLTEATGQRMATALESIAEGGEPEIADVYSSSATYAVGDYCIYNNTLYKCSTAISTAEAWTPAHWTATTVTAELKGKLGPGDVVNNLTSTATDKPLSAAQGKALNDKFGDSKILTSTYTSTAKIPAITTLGFLVHDYGGTVSAYALYGGRCDLIAGTGGITTDGNADGQTLTFPNSGTNRVMLIYR